MDLKKPVLIAEIGCNHMGDIEIAKQMISVAANYCNATHVKFQKRNNKELLPPEQYNAPHPNPDNSYGSTYGEHREFLEFNLDQHRELKDFCESLGVIYSTSVWDLTSAKEISSLSPDLIKIPSATNTNFTMLEWLCNNYSGEIHLSLGMTTIEEEKMIIELFNKNNRLKDLVLYACTSGYPVPFDQVYLLEINRIKENYGSLIKEIGFSGHHNGISIDPIAYSLGANVIERHFTLNRTWKGTDHAASLEPDGMRKLNRNLNAAMESLNYKPTEIVEIEIPQRRKLKHNA